jgi:hypothetical protein
LPGSSQNAATREEEVADLRRVSAEFNAWQEKLAERVGQAGEAPRRVLFDETTE